jgi:predicted GNAT superfamily acetyltransferase
MTTPSGGRLAGARAAADAAALAARITTSELRGVDECRQAADLFATIWGRVAGPPITSELMLALSAAGGYLCGAFDGDELVGATVGFFASPERRTLHSHVSGVAPSFGGRAIGFALKLHQRAWAIERGIPTIEWTFDPLVSRNAHFNIVKLGAQPVAYHENFYGVMLDGINGGDESDRLLVRWTLDDPAVVAASTGSPIEPIIAHPSLTVPVPDDIAQLRREQPELAQEWRLRVREGLTRLLAEGTGPIGFHRAAGYVSAARERTSTA